MSVLIFLDIETTGIDPHIDAILEVYAQPVDEYTLKPIADPFHAVIRHEDWSFLPDKVYQMHQANGLLDACEDSEIEIDVCMKSLAEYLNEFPKARLAGKQVGTFDRIFLEEDFAGCTDALHYQVVDLTALHFAFRTFGGGGAPKVNFNVPHRAKGDVLSDIEAFRVYADWIQEKSDL